MNQTYFYVFVVFSHSIQLCLLQSSVIDGVCYFLLYAAKYYIRSMEILTKCKQNFCWNEKKRPCHIWWKKSDASDAHTIKTNDRPIPRLITSIRAFFSCSNSQNTCKRKRKMKISGQFLARACWINRGTWFHLW